METQMEEKEGEGEIGQKEGRGKGIVEK